MENKNTVIALILMFLVWAVFSLFNPAAPPQVPNSPATSDAPVVSSTPVATVPVVTDQQLPSADAPVVATSERHIVVSTDLYDAVFTNSGARLLSLSLKKFHTTQSPDSPPVQVIDIAQTQQGTLGLSGSGSLAIADSILYTVQDDLSAIQLSGTESRDLIFRVTTPSGLLIEKKFTFHADKYDFDVATFIANRSDKLLSGDLTLALFHPWDDKMAGGAYDFVGPVTFSKDKLYTDKVSKLEKEARSYDTSLVWSGFTNKYFLSALVPLDLTGLKLQVSKSGSAVLNTFQFPAASLAPGSSLQYRFLAYFGPLQMDDLRAADHQLERALDFGFFSILAKPLFHVLIFFHGFIGNYGWSIILLTVIIKLLFWPLTHKSYMSMKSMQRLQPEMQKLREKYKNDRDRMNREVMELYKTHRVNPVGGCLPMLVQIPVFFALYKVLMISIELRHAPFIFWITDLSSKDPYYITPLIMGATMFIQQKMTPTTSIDPMQAKIFLFMPVVFTFMFLNFPSGLVVYWLVNNLLTITQQYFINRAK